MRTKISGENDRIKEVSDRRCLKKKKSHVLELSVNSQRLSAGFFVRAGNYLPKHSSSCMIMALPPGENPGEPFLGKGHKKASDIPGFRETFHFNSTRSS